MSRKCSKVSYRYMPKDPNLEDSLFWTLAAGDEVFHGNGFKVCLC